MNLKKIAFICNPAAGKGEALSYYETFKSFLPPETMCRCLKTRVKGSGQLKEVLKEGFSTFIIAGGDGTVHEFINELFPYSGEAVVGVIPVGTGNDLARSIMNYSAFSKNPSFFISALVDALSRESVETRRGSVFSMNNEIFWTCYMGIGFDGKIINSFHKYRKLRLPNRLIYFFAILKTLAQGVKVSVSFLPERRTARVSGPAKRDLFQLLLLNVSSYGGGMIQGEHMEGAEGFRLICIKSVTEFLSFFVKNSFLSYFKNTFFYSEHMELDTDNLVLEVSGPTPVQIDGEDYSKKFEKGGVIHVKKAGEITLILQKF